MKIKLLVACFTIFSFTHTMHHNPNVVVQVAERGMHFTLKPAEVPAIAIEQCAQCGNHAMHRCSSCQVVYYCSPLCQAKHWEAHNKCCQKFQSDIEYLRKAFSTFIDKAVATNDPKYIEQAMIFHLQTLMRAAQDKACAHDETISMDSIAYKDLQQFDNLVERNITNRNTLTALRNQLMQAAFAKVRKLTLENKLVAPYGIRRYGLQAFEHAKRQPGEFVPKDQWQGVRLQALDEKEEEFKKANPSLTDQE